MPPANIESTTREGYPAVTVKDGDLTATFVPQLGMIGASFTHRGEELLGQRNGLPAYEARGSTMGIPLLYPWANRLSGFHYEVAGKHVTIDGDSPLVKVDENGVPIHGLLNASPYWRAQPAGEAALTAVLDWGAHPELLEAFPFPHEMRLQAGLADGRLTITATVTATTDPVPVSFGFHPYLTLPDVSRADWHIELPVTEQLVLDDQSIPTGATEPANIPPGPLGDRTFDDGYAQLTGDPPTFVLQGGGRRIELSFDSGYDYAQVYAPEGQDLICFEPMTAATNALVAAGPGLQVLEPGDEKKAAFSIAVKDA
ncbi:MAG: aldose 1-epimerase [Thermoleophilaceae bacterium]|nr:aldose 1-epimerase [Thermoleophilaceae bacterium]